MPKGEKTKETWKYRDRVKIGKKISVTKRRLFAEGKITPSFLGKKHTQETKDMISNKLKGRFIGENNPNFGNVYSAEIRKKISEAKLGTTWTEEHKKSHSEKIKKKWKDPISEEGYRNALNQIHINSKGTPKSESHKQKLRVPKSEKAKVNMRIAANKKWATRPDLKENVRKHRINQIMPNKNTSIEKKIYKQLEEAEIIHEKQKPLESITIPDAFIEPNDKSYKGITIYADGEYWHSSSKRKEADKRITNDLFKKGYYVVRLKGKHIKEPDFDVVKILKEITPLEHVREKRKLAIA